jgi:RNA polymerase-interacting CarD/CdnL/TRCF family regulator
MSSPEEDSQTLNPLRPAYRDYERQACFVAHSRDTDWREDLVHACEEVLPKFGLQPWYADQHFDPTRPLRSKVVEAIANGRYGIYDISNWQDGEGRWHGPRNVYIELGMAVALNRPALILRHTSNQTIPLPACLSGLKILEFSGETTLKRALEKHLPQWTNVPPDRDWFNRFCIFGERVCGFREEHPRARQLGEKVMHCHVSDGFDTEKVNACAPEREEARAAIEEIFGRYADLKFHHLGDLQLAEGYQFLLCSHCQAARSSQFAVYRIMATTPPEVFIAIGMSIAIETLFDYDIPKVLLVRREQDLPSLLRGYEVVEVANSIELKRKLRAFVPAVMQKVRETTWRPRPLPFIEHQPTPAEEHAIKPARGRVEPTFQIPARAPFFIGREAFMQEAIALWGRENATIAITGVGGIGKTTLAAEIAQTATNLKLFPDGILWCDFYDVPSLADVLKNWLGVLGGDLTDAPVQELIRRWRDLIRKQRVLIVLDGVEVMNQEELTMLTSPVDCSMLLTTRNTSFPHRDDYVVFNLGPLARFESMELLRKLTAGGGKGTKLTDEEAAELASVGGGTPAFLHYIAGEVNKKAVQAVLRDLKKSDRTRVARDEAGDVADEQTNRDDELEDLILKVALEIETVMQRETFTPPGGPTYIPPEYIVFLSSEDDRDWQGEQRRRLEKELFLLLSESARKLSATNQLEGESFAIELRVDGTLNNGEYRVQHVWNEIAVKSDFKVGQRVVYPNHGIGTIEAIQEKQIGSNSLPFYVLRLGSNNSIVLVPVGNAPEVGLRRPIRPNQCQKVLRDLEANFTEPAADWKDRFKDFSEKMRTGDIFEVVDVLKHLRYMIGLKPLSFREQRMLERARYLVISEVAFVTGQSEKSAERLIEKALEKAMSRHRPRVW